MDKVIAIIDLKSFYASCECSARHLDPFAVPLVCADPSRGDGSVVMSVTPYLKSRYGVPNVCRKRDLPKVRGMIFAPPRMSFYLKMSSRVNSIFLDYIARDDLHIYSVDESFLNLTPYLSLYKKSPEDIVKDIQRRIYDELGLTATSGIGPNMFLAKLALDNEGKKKAPYLATWNEEDVEKKLWGIKELSDIWSIGERTASHLKRIGIRNVSDLAHAPTSLLESEFGIIGNQLQDLSNGIDESDIEETYIPKETSISLGQRLVRDYSKEEGRLILKEMSDDLLYRLRKAGMLAGKISLFIGYSNGYGGYSKQLSLPYPSDEFEDIHGAFSFVYEKNVSELPIRGINLSLSKLTDSDYAQSNLFEEEDRREKTRSLYRSLDKIRETFGRNSVLRCSSLLNHSTIKSRHSQIGGHKQ